MNLNDAQQQPQQGPPGQMQPGQGQQPIPPQQPGQPQQGQIPPEVQQQFDIFAANGMKIIHSKEVTDNLLNRVVNSGNPIEALAEILVDVVCRLADSAMENNIQLTNETLLQGANALLSELVGIAVTAGMQPLTEEQMVEIFQRAVSSYLDKSVKSGRMTKEQVVALSDQLKQTPEGQEVMKAAQNPPNMNNMQQQGQGPKQGHPGQGQVMPPQQQGGV